METKEPMESSELERLNALLEDERGSVEIEVALVNCVTDLSERDAITNLGVQEVGFCVALREHLERQNAPVSTRVNGIVLDVLGIERYDERLNAFADYQMRITETLPGIVESAPQSDLATLLREIEDAHLRSAAWSRRRSSAFAATRMLVFRGSADATYTEGQTVPGATNGSQLPHPTDER